MGTVINNLHSSDNSSLFQIDLVCLWISGRTGLHSALSSSAGYDEYLVIYIYIFSIAISKKAPRTDSSCSEVFVCVCLI